MNRRRSGMITPTGVVGITIATLGAAVAAGSAIPSDAAAPEVALTLTEVRELRSRVLVEPDPNKSAIFDRPGVTLVFGIETAPGLRVLDVGDPVDLEATDSTGRDLTDVEPDMFGNKKFVELAHAWDAPPSELTVRLALTDRSATTLDLAGALPIRVYEGVEVVVVTLADDWQPVDLGPDAPMATARMVEAGGMLQVELRPGTAKELLERVEVVVDGEPVESNGAIWNDQEAAFQFPGQVPPDAEVRFGVRRGVRQARVEVAVEGVQLP